MNEYLYIMDRFKSKDLIIDSVRFTLTFIPVLWQYPGNCDYMNSSGKNPGNTCNIIIPVYILSDDLNLINVDINSNVRMVDFEDHTYTVISELQIGKIEFLNIKKKYNNYKFYYVEDRLPYELVFENGSVISRSTIEHQSYEFIEDSTQEQTFKEAVNSYEAGDYSKALRW